MNQFADICLLVWGFLFASVRGQGCTFPSDLDGVFDSSHESGQLTFNSTHVYPFEVDTQSLQFTNMVFECNFSNGSKYIARSAEYFEIYTVPYHVYTCWEFSKQTSDSYVQYQATTKLASASNRNYKIYPIAWSVDSNTVCDVATPYTPDTISLLVKNGTASTSGKSSCPVSLWGQYVYQLTDTSGTSYCDFNSYLDICTSTDTLSINTTICSATTFYSTGGTLYCIYNEQDTSLTDTYYVFLYNDDASVDLSTTYRFTCLVMQYASNVTYMTQYPNQCLDSTNQNATYMTTSPGGLYTMFANVTCPPSTDSTDYTVIIVVVVLVLLILIIVIVIVIVYYYKKVYLAKKRRISSRIGPDGLPIWADKNFRTMFTPGPPKSAVPERRRQIMHDQGRQDSSRAGSALSMPPTVSALAGYRTPSPCVSEAIIDSDSLLDYDYNTKQHLNEPDGEESGVVLDMEGSIPVYSEAGDTPEPTQRTPVYHRRY